MRAVVQDRYGSPDELKEREVERPVPGEGEVLVRVRAASVHADVWHVVTGLPYVLRLMGAGLRRPVPEVPGTDLAGEVVAVGPGVTQLAVGDAVYGETVAGFQWKHGGTYAEYAVVAASELAPKPAHLDFEQASTLATAGLIALRNLRYGGGPQPGQKVLVNGAGGAVGGFAVPLAKAAGAEVTAVDCASKLELLRGLGADHVIDYTREDLTRGPVRYDLIFDVASNLTLGGCKRVLTPQGKYVLIGHDHYGQQGRRWLGSIPRAFGLMARSVLSSHLPRPDFNIDNSELFPALAELVETEKIAPVVDRTFSLDQVPEALRYLVEGTATGRIVIVP